MANQRRPSRRPADAVLRVVALGAAHAARRVEPDRVKPPAAHRDRLELGLAHAVDAAVARHPEVPAAVLDDPLRGVVEEPLLLPVRREGSVAEARQAAAGREPVRALGVLVDRDDDVVGEAVLGRPGRERVAVDARDAAAEGSDPEVPGVVLVDREDLLARQSVLDVVRPELSVLEAGEAVAGGPDPEEPLAVHAERRNPGSGQPLRRRVEGHLPFGQPRQARSLRADPEVAAVVLGDREHRGRKPRHALEGGAARTHPVEAAVGRSRPERAAAVFEDRPDLVVGQPFAPREVGHALALQAIQSAVGRADPEAALAVFVERQDPVRREPVGRREARERSVVEAVEAVARSDPDVSLPVAVDDSGEIVREAVGFGVEARGAGGHHVHEPATRPDPEPAGAVAGDGEGRSREALPDRAQLELSVVEVGKPRGQPEPEAAGFILVESPGAVARKSLALREQRQLAVADVGQAFVRGDPEGPVLRLEERPDQRALERRPLPHGLEPPFAHAGQPRQRADPERPVARLDEVLDPVVLELGSVARVEDGEPHAVETHEAFLRAEPEVAVAGLEDDLDRVLRQAGVAVPDVVAVVGGHGPALQPRRRDSQVQAERGAQNRRPRNRTPNRPPAARHKVSLRASMARAPPTPLEEQTPRLRKFMTGRDERTARRYERPGNEDKEKGSKPPKFNRLKRDSDLRIPSNPARVRAAARSSPHRASPREGGSKTRNRGTDDRPLPRTGPFLAVELLRLSARDRERLPRARGQVPRQHHDLAGVHGAVRERTVDGAQNRVRLAANEDLAGEVAGNERVERREQRRPPRFPSFEQARARVAGLALELGIAPAIGLLAVGRQKVRPARAQVAADVLDQDGDAVGVRVERQ